MFVSTIGRRALLGAVLTLAAGVGTARAEPDLFVREFSVQPPAVEPGGALAISGDVYNADLEAVAPGTLSAGGNGYMVDLVLSTDDFAPVNWAGYSPVFHEDVLLRGGRFSRTTDVDFYDFYSFRGPALEIPGDTPPGDYFVCAVVDPGQRVAETDEGNNRICTPIRVVATVPELPDFVSEVTGTRTECQDGRNLVTVLVNLRNIGPGTFVSPDDRRVRPFAVAYLRFDGNQHRLASISIGGPLVPGAGNTAPMEIRHPPFEKLYGRTVTVRIVVDPEEEVDEADENNNEYMTEIDLPPLDCG